MAGRSIRFILWGLCQIAVYGGMGQSQTCPVNSNFVQGSLTHWWAYTGNNKQGNGTSSIKAKYDSTLPASAGGTIGATQINDYNLGTPGIRVITVNGTDPFGQYQTIPTVNGYQYKYSVLLGSTSISRGSTGSNIQGGYTRGISYRIKVPLGPEGEPYTMTYAYAMVLENGTHNSNQQPLFSATLKTHDSIITCASPSYYLPTSNNADPRGTGATLDTATALRQGFSLSNEASPNQNPNSPNGGRLRDIWTKGWREVTFDLSPYRGEDVSLTFEADNCIPGGHFAYAYIALRDNCAGLIISGDTVACTNSPMVYSIPALGDGSYEWTFPPGWTVTGEQSDNNIINVIAGSAGGQIIAHEVNGCADLRDTIQVKTTPPTVAGRLIGGAPVCTGENTNVLTLDGSLGNILNWISTVDQSLYVPISDTKTTYTANNLTATTTFRAVVQNGPTCAIDTSEGITIRVDQKSIGGDLNPSSYTLCKDQDKEAYLSIAGKLGAVLSWQSSTNGVDWSDVSPANTDSVFSFVGLPVPTQFRAIVENGVCPADTSTIASVLLTNGVFPRAVLNPVDTSICYDGKATLEASIDIGTSYHWNNVSTLTNAGDGAIPYTPLGLEVVAAPRGTTLYVLSVANTGCPNERLDSSLVNVLAPILVNAGNDTSVVFSEPLQFQAFAADAGGDSFDFLWTPGTDLNNPAIANPVGIYAAGTDSIRYVVRATAPNGCYGEDNILVRVFKTAPDIFVPNAFTPGMGSNGIFRPIPVGIASLHFFRVYNRYGQLVYSTEQIGQGWDGRINGTMQTSGAYVWMVEGTDYTGRVLARKGTMVLVR